MGGYSDGKTLVRYGRRSFVSLAVKSHTREDSGLPLDTLHID
jgi:hypothetical protein